MFTPLAAMNRWSHRATLFLSLYCILGGLASFLGWAYDVQALTDWIGNGISIQPNTTVAAMAAGTGILLLAVGYPTAAIFFGGVVTLIGSTVLFEFITD